MTDTRKHFAAECNGSPSNGEPAHSASRVPRPVPVAVTGRIGAHRSLAEAQRC